MIPVTVAVDDAFRADPLWTHSVARAFSEANGLIGAPLGIRFKVERRAGWTPAGATLDDYLGRLRAQIGVRPGGIVIGLTCRRPEPRRVFGATDYVDALTVLSVPSAGEAWDRKLAHELGHVLGAIDVEGDDELMAARGQGGRIDAMNAGLMQAHQKRRFPPARFPLEGAELDAVARLYQEAALIAPAEAYPALIRVERARGDLQAALRAAVRLVAVRPDGRSLDLRAQVLADLGRLEEPTRAGSGRREEAIDSYRRAVALDPDNAPALADLARLLLEAGRPEEAIDPARRALRAQPGLQAAQVNLAAAYLASGDDSRAEAEARRALGLASGDAARTARLGVAFEHAGLPARARQAFEMALQADPLQPVALAGRGRLRLHAGDAAGAAADLARAVQQDAEVATGWVNLAAAYLEQGRDREAEQAIREELRRRPRSPQAYTNLALVQQLRGDLEGALDLQERAAELAPDDPDVLANLGALKAQAGRGSEALRAYLRLLELRPDDGPCHNDVAVLYFREGQVDAARRHAARALALGAPVSRDFLAALAGAPGGESSASAR